jgi:transcriptional regulator with XRE-family HTH domain
MHVTRMKLSDYLEANGITDAEFAALIRKDRSSVTRLRSGDTKPSWDTAQKIAEVTNGVVTPNDFISVETSTEAAQ